MKYVVLKDNGDYYDSSNSWQTANESAAQWAKDHGRTCRLYKLAVSFEPKTTILVTEEKQ